MRFKRVSNHFWKVEFNGFISIGTWEQINRELLSISNRDY